MATKKPVIKSSHPKKELKKELEDKIGSALPEMKAKLGDKKFQERIKKAAKILVQGLHSKDFSEPDGMQANAVKAASEKIKTLKKVKAKKS